MITDHEYTWAGMNDSWHHDASRLILETTISERTEQLEPCSAHLIYRNIRGVPRQFLRIEAQGANNEPPDDENDGESRNRTRYIAVREDLGALHTSYRYYCGASESKKIQRIADVSICFTKTQRRFLVFIIMS